MQRSNLPIMLSTVVGNDGLHHSNQSPREQHRYFDPHNEKEMFHSGDDIGAVVADIGTYSCRIGFAGDDMPKAYFPTSVGRIPKAGNSSSSGGGGNEELVFSPNQYRDSMEIHSPVMDGIIVDWDLLEKLWNYSLTTCLKTDIKGLPVLMAEKPFITPPARRKLCELIFDKFSASAFFLSKDAVLSCYAVGKTSGLVVDCGGGGTVVTPVLDGWVELKALSRSNLSGRLMDAYMLNLVSKRLKGYPRPLYKLNKTVVPERNHDIFVNDNPALTNVARSFQAYMNLELGRDVKEAVCKISDQLLSENEQRYSSLPTTSYELPDGTIIDLGIERFQIPELFVDSAPLLLHPVLPNNNNNTFGLSPPPPSTAPTASASSASSATANPTTSNSSSSSSSGSSPYPWDTQEDLSNLYSGSTQKTHGNILPFSLDTIPKMVCDSILRSDQDAQSTLLANMVLAGGNASYDGLLERLRYEVERRIHQHAPGMKVRMISNNTNTERAICAWLGGSIVGSLGSFHEIWVSKKEYDEFGGNIVDRKCP